MNALLSTAYWPNLHYFFYLLNSTQTFIEAHENYVKQTYRNRTVILSANGKLDLVIPVAHKKAKQAIREIEISYSENWQVKHWRAITSAYKNSPFFEFFEDEIKPFYFEKHSLLFDYNMKQLELVLKILRVKKNVFLSENFLEESVDALDLRNRIHPKIALSEDEKVGPFLKRTYYQTFENKFGFTPNLSILDLLFNEGKHAKSYFPSDTLTL